MRGRASGGATIVIAAMVAVIGACASPAPSTTEGATNADSTTAAAPAGPQAATSGETLHVTTSEGTAAYTVDNLQPVPVEAVMIPAKGTMYAVDVTIQTETGTTTVNGFYFVARAADGATIAPAVGAVNPGITSGQLTQGQDMAGHVAYDLPPGESIVQITLRDPKGNPLAAWSVA